MKKIIFLIGILLCVLEVRAQVINPFAIRYQTSDKGTVMLVGNTLMTCPAGGCSGVNNDYNMVYVDIDGDPSTFNSSSANFTVPSGGAVLWAGLYWGGVPNNDQKEKVLFKTPATSAYQNITGTLYSSSYGYQGFKDVTALVQAGGTGTYKVANVKSATGSNKWAGWALVVVVRDPALPMRNLTVFDGFALVDNSHPNVNISISGFVTPPAGPVNVELGVVAYDGDNTYTGDQFKLNGTNVSNALNPSNDFFNSSITRLGTALTAKSPNYSNQLGLDIDVVNATGYIANGATSATINLTTGGESYLPGVVTSAIDLFAPDISITKSMVDINGGELVPGDTLLYTISLINNGMDGATKVIVEDSIRAHQAFVPGSLKILTGANAGNKTDNTGDDQAEFTSGKAIFRLGTGANSSLGGTLAPSATTSASFRTVVFDNVTDSTAAENVANIAYSNQTAPYKEFVGASPLVEKPIRTTADLSLTKSVDTPNPTQNQLVTFTIQAHNAGPNIATNVVVKDLLPAGLSFQGYSTSSGSYADVTGEWTIGNILPGATKTLQITAQVTGTSPITNTAEVKNSDQRDPDSTPDNNNAGEDDQASATITPVVLSDLSITKTVYPVSPNEFDTLTYTITVHNAGPAAATGVVVQDALPGTLTYVSSAPSQGAYSDITGIWTVGSIANGASATMNIKAIVLTADPITNVASITSSDQPDPDGLDRTDSVTVPQQIADLSLDKSVTPSNPAPNSNITYTIKVKNDGPNSGTAVHVEDLLPAGLSFVTANPSQGNFNNTTGDWLLGTIATGDSASLQIIATINGQTMIKNVANISASHQADPDSADRIDSVFVQAQLADLNLTKTVNDTLPADGATIVYTLTIHNSGPVTATGISVRDVLPFGLIYLSSSASQGGYDTATSVWTVGSLASGASATLHISVKVLYNNFCAGNVNLGPATGYNLFVLNDLSQPSADTEGKVAVGHDATLPNYSVGNKLPNSGGTVDVLVCGRNLLYGAGGIWGGNVVYGNLSNLPTNPVTIFDGAVRKDTVIDFDAARTYLHGLSSSLSGYSVNGMSAIDWGKLTLTGTDPFLNVFQVDGSSLTNCHTFEINVPNGSVVLVNISGTDIKLHGGLFINGTDNRSVLYNFYEADSLIITGIDVRGTVLAPYASVNFIGGVVNGQMICNNMYGPGQFNNTMFIGNIPVDQYLHNTAEVLTSDQYDPNSTPNNGVVGEDDMASCAVHITSMATSGSTSGWSLVGNFPNTEIILCMNYDFAGNMLIGTLGGKIYRSTDSGINWTHINQGMVNAFIWTLAKDKSNHIFCGTEAGVYRSDDNGGTWNKLANYPMYDTRAIVVDTNNVTYAAAWGFGIYKSTDAGDSWTTAKSGMTSLTVTSLAVSKENELYAGNFGDGVLKSVDGGATWTNLNIGYNFVWSLACADSGEVLAGSYGDGLYISQNHGASWYRSSNFNYSTFIYSITVDSLNNKYISTWLSGVYFIPANSLSMSPLGLNGLKISSVMYDPRTKTLYAGTSNGKLYVRTETTTAVKEKTTDLPVQYQLSQNYPNPFNPSTVIRYAIPNAGAVTLKVYDVLGREVATLVNEVKNAGYYEVSFNASRYASGIYFYSLQAGEFSSVKKMMLVK